MATSYQDIIDAIDARIALDIDKPGIVSAGGRTVQYRNLYELRETRKMYVELLSQQSRGGGKRFGMTRIKSPGAQI